MKKVIRHTIDKDSIEWVYDDNVVEFETDIIEAKQNPKLVGLIAKRALEYFYYASALNKKEDIVKFIQVATKSHKTDLDLKLNPGQVVEAELDNSGKFPLKAEDKSREIEDTNWILLWNLSVITRNKYYLKWLADFDKSKVKLLNEKDHIKIFTEYFLLLHHYANHSEINTQIQNSINDLGKRNFGEKLDPPSVKDFPGPSMYMVFTQFNVFTSLVSKNELLFNEWLLKAVEYHKEFWSQKRGLNKGESPLSDDPQGFLSIPLTALCSMAFDQGIKIEVESDYIPKDLYEGKILKG